MELLIAFLDHGPDVDHIKAGEVIAAQSDGWGWTLAELNNPYWRIIRAPIIPTHAATLMEPHTWAEQVPVGVRVPRKRNLLDVAVLGALEVGQINERTQGDIARANRRIA